MTMNCAITMNVYNICRERWMWIRRRTSGRLRGTVARYAGSRSRGGRRQRTCCSRRWSQRHGVSPAGPPRSRNTRPTRTRWRLTGDVIVTCSLHHYHLSIAVSSAVKCLLFTCHILSLDSFDCRSNVLQFNGQHLNSDDCCPGDKKADHRNCSVLCIAITV